MRAIRNNLAFILLGLFAVVLIYFMVRLQGLVLATQSTSQPVPTSQPMATSMPLAVQPQPTVVGIATATSAVSSAVDNTTAENVEVVGSTPTDTVLSGTGGYQVYGSTIIGAIHIGAATDRGFNQANDEGLRQMLEQVPNTRLISVDNIPETAEVLPVIDDMVTRGARVIFSQSFGYLPYVLEAAERYPDIVFMNAGGFELSDNVGTYLANHVEAMYLTGMAAGAATATDQLGFISAFPMPSSLASVNAFQLGARSVNPDVKTYIINNGAWVDPAKERQATEALASSGVDVVAMIVDSPITIVETAQERGMYVIGFHSASLQELAPENWLTGVEHTWGNFFTQVVEQAKAGNWQSGHVRGGIESDMFGLAPFGPAVTQEMQAQILATRDDIIRGRLNVFAGPIVDNAGVMRVPAGRVGDPLLLDQTDWLMEGVSELDVATVVIQPPPENLTLPHVTNAIADKVNNRLNSATSTPQTATTVVSVLEPTANLLLGVTDHHPECQFFTEVVANLLQERFTQTVEIIDFASDDDLYQAIAARLEQRVVDLTLCYGDPADRPFLRMHIGFLKHIGDAYWQGVDYRLQILANTSFATETERNQSCIYNFLRNIHFEDVEQTEQNVTEWISMHAELVDAWIVCE